MRRCGLLLLASLIAGLLPSAAHARADHVPIGYVRILNVTQTPYAPIKLRMAIKAPVGLTVSVGYKVFDARGISVYHELKQRLRQPYPETSLTLTWHKRGYDGNAVPKGRVYYLVPYAGDLEDRDGDDGPGQLVRGRRYQIILR
jgi:hypothetical protein